MPTKFCKDCIAEGVNRMRPAPHPGPRCATHHRAVRNARKARAHGSHVERTYGITAEEYDALYRAQGGRCFICQRAKGLSKKLPVDHDHRIEAEQGVRASVRGLICVRCNDMLGHARDDVQFFARAIMYLVDPPARRVLRRLDRGMTS